MHFVKPFLYISNNHVDIIDLYNGNKIELTYSNDLEELNLQLLFYNLKISTLCFKDSYYTRYKLQNL